MNIVVRSVVNGLGGFISVIREVVGDISRYSENIRTSVPIIRKSDETGNDVTAIPFNCRVPVDRF